MSSLLTKTWIHFRKHGLVATLRVIAGYPLARYRRAKLRNLVFRSPDIEERFTAIYEHNYWENGESASGNGSTIAYTRQLREKLPDLFSRFSIRSIFDAPCGDFNWISLVQKETGLEYIGGDIVLPLIESHNRKHAGDKVRFIHLDLTRQPFPKADLMICRDCLFHLSFEDTAAVLRNFVASGIPYLLTTTHANSGAFTNKDILTGDFRLIDLFAPPYNFPPDVLYRIDDWQEPEPRREMCLWRREQVEEALKKFGTIP